MLLPRLQQGHDLGTVLNVTVQVVQKQRKILVMIALVGRLLVVVIGKYVLLDIPGSEAFLAANQAGSQPNPAEVMAFLQEAKVVWPSLWLLWLVIMLISMIVHISIVRLTAATIEGEPYSRKTIVEKGLERVFPLIGTNIVMGILLLLLFVLLIIPGIAFTIYWVFAGTVTILLGVRGWEALKKSKELVQGRRWQTLRVAFGSAILLSITKELIGTLLVLTTRKRLTAPQMGAIDVLIEIFFLLVGFVMTTVFFYRRKVTNQAVIPQEQMQRKSL